MPSRIDPFSVAVVGSGPWGTYAVERVASLAYAELLPRSLRLVVFESSGNFGCGRVHHDKQVESSQLNRVASQIGFAADEAISDVVLPPHLRPTMAEWARAKFVETRDERYLLGPTEVPSRAMHGEALRAAFERYVSALRELPGVEVCLVAERVDRLVPLPRGRVGLEAGSQTWVADRALLTTGHGADELSPYPLRENLDDSVPAGSEIALEGMGLTSIDVVLALTEGRGGTFAHSSSTSGLTYHPSGNEPARIFPFSRSGYFASARPRNEKATDPSGKGHVAQQLSARHLTEQNVDTLTTRHQVLEFRQFAEPLIVAEMTETFYRTLLGDEASQTLPDLRSQSRALCANKIDTDEFYFALNSLHNAYLEAVDDSNSIGARHATALLAELPIQPEHGSSTLSSLAVDWRKQVGSPIEEQFTTDHANFVYTRMVWDLACARQGNVRNPWKAAWDGVWRDLRSSIGAMVDSERLAIQSREYFTSVLRTYNREVNGASDAAIAKLIALIDASIVDLKYSRTPRIGFCTEEERSHSGGLCAPVDLVVPGRVRSSVLISRRDPLYSRLVDNGLLEFADSPSGEVSYMRLDQDFHPRRGSDSWKEVTILGAPTEGFVFFQLALARPHAPNAALVSIERWARELVAGAHIESESSHPRRMREHV